MLARLLEIWTRYRDADRRQLPLFPDWERARWLMPMPSVVARTAQAMTLLDVAPMSRPYLLMTP